MVSDIYRTSGPRSISLFSFGWVGWVFVTAIDLTIGPGPSPYNFVLLNLTSYDGNPGKLEYFLYDIYIYIQINIYI